MLLLMLFVDLKKSRMEQARFLEDERILREKLAESSNDGSGTFKVG